MRFILFASIFLTVFALLSFYISRRLISKLDISKSNKTLLNLFLVINFLGIIGYMFTRYLVSVPNELYFLFSLPIGIIFLLFITTLMYEVLSHLPKITKDEKRRDFFKKSIDISSLVFATSLTTKAVYDARHIVIEKVNVKINNLKHPYSMVQLSDVHIGGIIDKAFIANMIEQVNILKPDLVVITGDLIDTDLSYIKDAVYELTHLNSKYGTYFIVGNHEYFHGVQEIMSHLNSIGIKVLENENVYIGEKNKGFNLAGVYDVFGYRTDNFKPDIKQALLNRENDPTILLAHQPKYIDEVNDVDLVLSGHTHGGQIAPFNLLVRLVQPYVKGLHQHNKRTQIYVNKGTGFWGPPMRLCASAEITHLTLSPA